MLRFSSTRVLAIGLLFVATWGWFGCVSETKQPKRAGVQVARGEIQQINLLAVPVALNFDQSPGPDGFVVKVYASNSKSAKSVPIENGKIDLLMFDGVPESAANAPLKPLRVWSFTAEELKPFEIHTSIGTGYQLAPVWGPAKPGANNISVVARYTTSTGRNVYSAPSVISVGPR
jgi:hypothetical protein